MAIINRLPLGFLSFLDQQTQGKNPQEPAPSLLLTTDLTAHYRAQLVVGHSVTVNVDCTTETTIVNSSVASITVPEGFAWEILGVEARANPNGVIATSFTYMNQIQLRIPFNLGGVGVDFCVAGSPRQTFTAVDATTMFLSTSWQPNQRLILGPGVRIRAQITEATGALVGFIGLQNTIQIARYQYQI